MSSFPSSLLNPFLNALRTPASLDSTTNDHPNYYLHDPSTLVTSSQIKDFSISTGASLFSHFQPVLLSAQHSLTIVTCFWALSESLETLNHVLRTLSSRALADGNGNGTGKLRVRIRFSSLSVTQKLFHTRSLSGQPWPPATWVSELGLPHPSELTGLDLEVKSIFVLPFSVMHPKFVIVDSHTVLLPSCNVSWEDWCEGCVELSGDIVGQFIRFHNAFWADTTPTTTTTVTIATNYDDDDDNDECHISPSHPDQPRPSNNTTATPSLFLPSPHHTNPDFTFPFFPAHPPPATPLNTFLLTALAHATRSVFITTPNLTSPPLISAILSALRSGVDITIYTSARMMFLEQLLTAGTITEWCVWRLKRKYRKLLLQLDNTKNTARRKPTSTPRGILTRWSKKDSNSNNNNNNNTHNDARILRDIEQQMPLHTQSQTQLQSNHHNNDDHHADEEVINQRQQRNKKRIGRLNLFYFTPTPTPNSRSSSSPSASPVQVQAAKLHFKSTIIDDEIVVLGSGNMDRASWYTSQELGVAFASRDFAREVQEKFHRFLTVHDDGEEGDGGMARMRVRRVI